MKTTTIRMDDDTLKRVDGLAETMQRSRSWFLNYAVRQCLDYEEWYIEEVKKGLIDYELGEVATKEQSAKFFEKWGL